MNTIRIGIIQALLRGSGEARRARVRALTEQAAGQGADLVTLPEIWNGPYQQELFPTFAEPRFGPSWQFLSELAAEYGMEQTYYDYDELLADSEIEFVYVGLINAVHYEYTKKALLAGIITNC